PACRVGDAVVKAGSIIEPEGPVRAAAVADEVHAVGVAVARGPFVQNRLEREVVLVIGGRAADENIVAGVAVQLVRPIAADDDVPSIAGDDLIVAVAANQDVVADAADDGVVASLAVDTVIAQGAVDRIVAGAAQEQVVADAAVD